MIQDDGREKELIKKFKLKQVPSRKRQDLDAFLLLEKNLFEFELKSTTVGDVSTASPVTIDHINKWRKLHWLIGIYDDTTVKLKHVLYASPTMMTDWLNLQEEDIQRGLTISHALVEKIDYELLYKIFSEKQTYTFEEAKKVYKKLWTKSEYMLMSDVPGGFTSATMLKMFQDHNLSYMIRGSFLNNPKITKKYTDKFIKIDSAFAKTLRKIISPT